MNIIKLINEAKGEAVVNTLTRICFDNFKEVVNILAGQASPGSRGQHVQRVFFLKKEDIKRLNWRHFGVRLSGKHVEYSFDDFPVELDFLALSILFSSDYREIDSSGKFRILKYESGNQYGMAVNIHVPFSILTKDVSQIRKYYPEAHRNMKVAIQHEYIHAMQGTKEGFDDSGNLVKAIGDSKFKEFNRAYNTEREVEAHIRGFYRDFKARGKEMIDGRHLKNDFPLFVLQTLKRRAADFINFNYPNYKKEMFQDFKKLGYKW